MPFLWQKRTLKARKSFAGSLLILLMATLATDSMAQTTEVAFCDQSYLNDCLDLESDLCLEKFHACGRYNSIIQHFGSESIGGTSESARYYKGISYYGLYIRNRAYSLKCQFSSQARSELVAYLSAKKESGFRTQRDFNRVYHAAKLMQELRTIEGCPETGVSEDEIRFTVETYADRVLKSLFVGGSLSGGLGDQVKQTKRDIQATVGGFVSVAAATETQLEMREIALQASYQRLAKIAESFGTHFGNATFNVDDQGRIEISLDFDPNRGFRKAERNAQTWYLRVEDVEQRLNQAMGQMNINDYEKARKGFVDKAQYSIQRAASIANANSQLTDSGRSPALAQLKAVVGRESEQSNARSIIEDIRSAWASSTIGSFNCYIISPRPWYCEQLLDDTFSLIPVQ